MPYKKLKNGNSVIQHMECLDKNLAAICWLHIENDVKLLPKPNHFVMVGGVGIQTNSGLTFTKEQLEEIVSKMSEGDTMHFAAMENQIITNEAMFEIFDNVQLRNQHMNIQWPVTKDTNRLKVSATGSGWYLYYKNDNGEYEKAKRPDGSDWHVYSRFDGLKYMYKLNGWKQPIGGFK